MGTMASQITNLNITFSTVYPGTDQRKHQSSASMAFVRGIHWWPVNSPHKGPVMRKMFAFDDVIMYEDNINHEITSTHGIEFLWWTGSCLLEITEIAHILFFLHKNKFYSSKNQISTVRFNVLSFSVIEWLMVHLDSCHLAALGVHWRNTNYSQVLGNISRHMASSPNKFSWGSKYIDDVHSVLHSEQIIVV